MDGQMKLVDYGTYCKLCKHFPAEETKDPCNVCLGNPARVGTKVPEYWEGEAKR